jgi:hypothetical protein
VSALDARKRFRYFPSMRVYRTYSHKDGESFIQQQHDGELAEVLGAIASADAVHCLRKKSEERTKPALIFSPPALNECIKGQLHRGGWALKDAARKLGHREPRITWKNGQFREMDGVKNRVGLEVQFGKYAFMGYDILSKMVIFRKHGLIECGIEVVADASLIHDMSTGVSSFDQIILDLRERGAADLDIPVLIVGIGLTDAEREGCDQKRMRYMRDPEAMITSGEVDGRRKGAPPGPK